MMRFLHTAILTGLLLGFVLTGHAQNWVLHGKITEAGTDEAIPYVNIGVQGTGQGMVSREDGTYRLEVEGETVDLVVSRLGYRRQTLRVQHRASVQRFDIVLETSDIQLDDVVISDGLQRVFEDPTLHLYDYEFYDEHLFVILYDRKRRRSRIALVNEKDSIIAVTDGVEEPGKLFKDCLGNVHVLGKQYACQLFVVNPDGSGNQIAMYRDPRSTFEKVVQPCLASLDEFRYYKRGYGNDQLMHYFAHNVEKQTNHGLMVIRDKDRLHQLLDPKGLYAGLASNEAELLAIPPETWEKINKIDRNYQFNRLAFFYPVSAPLHVVYKHVMLFDHTNGQIHKLKKFGAHVSSTDISYHKEPHWQRIIYLDEVRQEAYAAYSRGGFLTLKEIDLETGALKASYELPRQFPMKVTVRDGVVFFMYKELDYDTTNRLYRLRIKD
ncbi:MAG: carboxypeptidase-like regulatory domain-containing protein [Bacteroidota bacterium]